MQYEEVLEKLRASADPKWAEGMARYGIETERAYGIAVPTLRKLAREIGKNHALAEQLWGSGVHEGRMVAAMIDNPRLVTEEQMERWASEFDSWDICDCCTHNLFLKTPFAYQKAVEWSGREEEFVKRAAFALMAALAVHDKKASDGQFLAFLPIIKRASDDNRNFVKKAVNWALRQIGKRNANLNRSAIETAQQIMSMEAKSARWIAADALKELTGEEVQARLRR